MVTHSSASFRVFKKFKIQNCFAVNQLKFEEESGAYVNFEPIQSFEHSDLIAL